MEELSYRLALNCLPLMGPATFQRLLQSCGSAAAAWRAAPERLAELGLRPETVAAFRGGDPERLAADQEKRLRECGGRVVNREDAEYPELLKSIPNPPVMLYCRGSLALDHSLNFAVVGTRHPTPYGQDAARTFTAALCRYGMNIVSGLAKGVDALAHEAALQAGNRSIAVLGCGVDIPYPPENAALYGHLVAQGVVLSEYPLGTEPNPQNFPRRNRIISGLAAGVLVVEAGARSGALLTAQYAREQGREVFAVPGPYHYPSFAGNHALIQEGARLAAQASDILLKLQPGLPLAAARPAAAAPAAGSEPLPPEAAAVYSELSLRPVHIDHLVKKTRKSVPELLNILLSLEMSGKIQQVSGKTFMRVM